MHPDLVSPWVVEPGAHRPAACLVPPSLRLVMLTMSKSDLIWPPERPRAAAPGSEWSQARSNLCLDFHGDPRSAQLVVFSDGNHHMALAECVEAFVRRNPGLHEVFYTTTSPSVYLTWMRTGELNLGNLTLRVRPNVVIGPRDVIERLHAEGETGAPVAFARIRGNAYLVRAGNPKGIRGRGGSAPAGCGSVRVESRDGGRELRRVPGDDARDGKDSGAGCGGVVAAALGGGGGG